MRDRPQSMASRSLRLPPNIRGLSITTRSATTGYSGVSDWAYHGSIAFSSDGGVQQGTSGSFAQPAGDTSHYLGGVNGAAAAFGPIYFGGLTGSVVMFTSYQPDSFNIYWGSID